MKISRGFPENILFPSTFAIHREPPPSERIDNDKSNNRRNGLPS